MVSIIKKFEYVVFFIVLVCSGCAKKDLNHHNVASAIYTERRQDVLISVSRLNAQESCNQFGRNLIKFGYQPYTITITNESDDQLFFRASSIDLPLVSASDMRQNTGYSCVGLSIVPLYLAALYAWPLVFPVLGAGVWIAIRNKQVKEKIHEQFLGEDKAIEILPFERISRTIFVPLYELQDQFNLHIFKRDTKTFVPFTIRL